MEWLRLGQWDLGRPGMTANQINYWRRLNSLIQYTWTPLLEEGFNKSKALEEWHKHGANYPRLCIDRPDRKMLWMNLCGSGVTQAVTHNGELTIKPDLSLWHMWHMWHLSHVRMVLWHMWHMSHTSHRRSPTTVNSQWSQNCHMMYGWHCNTCDTSQ